MLKSLGKTKQRKIRVLTGLSLLLIAGIVFVYLAIVTPYWFLLLPGSVGIIIFIMGLPIVKTEEMYLGDHLLKSDSSNTVYFNQLISIDENWTHWIYRYIIWSITESRYSNYSYSPGWHFFKITFEESGQVKMIYVLIDPEKKKIFHRFLNLIQTTNPFIQLHVDKFLSSEN